MPDYRIEDLIDIPKFQAMLDSLYMASGIPSAIIDVDGNILTGSGWQDACTKFHRVNCLTVKRCLESDAYLQNHLQEGNAQVVYRCLNGLVDTATAVVIEGRHLANVFTGQVLLQQPDVEFFRQQAREFDFDEGAYLEAVKRVPILTDEQLRRNLEFLAMFTEVLAEIGLRRIRERQTEEELRQSQKMELLGRFSGGIAHDFNNVLLGIMSYASLLEEEIPPGSQLKDYAAGIQLLSERAAQLTKGLLAFSRKQVFELKTVDLNETIQQVGSILGRILGEDIEIAQSLEPAPLPVLADQSQIEQMILNCVTNARDAMPEGGVLSIRTRRVSPDSAEIDGGEATPGLWAELSISDTGVGMTGEVKAKIFEPFFTTKPVGKGTGLGLSTVYGAVKQLDGTIFVESEPGAGSTFRILLPLGRGEARPAHRSEGVPPHGSETVLLAEDAPEVRQLAVRLLEDHGYRVIAAADGAEAIARFEEHRDEIDIAVLDVVMPHRSGRHVFNDIRAARPDVKVLFVSGYTDDFLSLRNVRDEKLSFLPKPYLPLDFLRKIREVLDN